MYVLFMQLYITPTLMQSQEDEISLVICILLQNENTFHMYIILYAELIIY